MQCKEFDGAQQKEGVILIYLFYNLFSRSKESCKRFFTAWENKLQIDMTLS